MCGAHFALIHGLPEPSSPPSFSLPENKFKGKIFLFLPEFIPFLSSLLEVWRARALALGQVSPFVLAPGIKK